jgi:Na+-transporting NADH:ubiquinone oxidoreductase subunit NqrB
MTILVLWAHSIPPPTKTLSSCILFAANLFAVRNHMDVMNNTAFLRQIPARAWWDDFRADARHFQILFLGSFLSYGVWVLDWGADPWKFLAIIGTALGTQALFARWRGQGLDTLKSALISSLSLCILFKANHYATYALAAFLAIAGKYLLRVGGKHLFNPANFGIVGTILLFMGLDWVQRQTGWPLGVALDGWISPGQWGTGFVLAFAICSAGGMVLLKAGRIDTGLAFAGTFLLCHYGLYVAYRGWPADFFTHQAFNGALWLFSLFMITDPMTSPNHWLARILWAAGAAYVAFYLQAFYWVNGAPLWVLFFLTPLTVLFDKVLRAPAFRWTPR